MKKYKNLDSSESRLTYLINQLSDKLENEDLNRTYNRLLVERASVRQKLKKKKSTNVLTSFCQKLNRKRHEKLISDYFKNRPVEL